MLEGAAPLTLLTVNVKPTLSAISATIQTSDENLKVQKVTVSPFRQKRAKTEGRVHSRHSSSWSSDPWTLRHHRLLARSGNTFRTNVSEIQLVFLPPFGCSLPATARASHRSCSSRFVSSPGQTSRNFSEKHFRCKTLTFSQSTVSVFLFNDTRHTLTHRRPQSAAPRGRVPLRRRFI